MNEQWFLNAMDILGREIENTIKPRWTQTISMSGSGAKLNQQFTMNLKSYSVGWNREYLYVKANGTEKWFKVNQSNPDATLAEVIKYIRL